MLVTFSYDCLPCGCLDGRLRPQPPLRSRTRNGSCLKFHPRSDNRLITRRGDDAVPECAVAKRSSQRSGERSLQIANDRNGVVPSPLHSRRRREVTGAQGLLRLRARDNPTDGNRTPRSVAPETPSPASGYRRMAPASPCGSPQPVRKKSAEFSAHTFRARPTTTRNPRNSADFTCRQPLANTPMQSINYR